MFLSLVSDYFLYIRRFSVKSIDITRTQMEIHVQIYMYVCKFKESKQTIIEVLMT